MASDKTLLKSHGGVTLTKVSLSDGRVVVAQRYVVRTRRVAESWDYDTLTDAEARWFEEVRLCGLGGP